MMRRNAPPAKKSPQSGGDPPSLTPKSGQKKRRVQAAVPAKLAEDGITLREKRVTRPAHQFKSGQSGNPAGKPQGSRHKSTIAAMNMLEDEMGTITRKCINLAKKGDPVALKLCMDRMVPVKKERPTPPMDIPKITSIQDVPQAMACVAEHLFTGFLTPGEGVMFVGLLKTIAEAFVTLKSGDSSGKDPAALAAQFRAAANAMDAVSTIPIES